MDLYLINDDDDSQRSFMMGLPIVGASVSLDTGGGGENTKLPSGCAP